MKASLLLRAVSLCIAAGALGARAGTVDSDLYVDVSPDGKRVVTIEGRMKVRIADRDGAALSDFSLASSALSDAFAPDGRKLALCTAGSGLVVWQEGKANAAVEPSGQCSSLNWSQDGQTLVYSVTTEDASGTRTAAKLWDAVSGKSRTLKETRSKAAPAAAPAAVSAGRSDPPPPGRPAPAAPARTGPDPMKHAAPIPRPEPPRAEMPAPPPPEKPKAAAPQSDSPTLPGYVAPPAPPVIPEPPPPPEKPRPRGNPRN